MPSLAQRFRKGLNDRIFDRLGEVASIDGVDHKGIFNRRYQEVAIQDGVVVGLEFSFACSYTQKVAELQEGDPIFIDVDGDGKVCRFCFRRRFPEEGDETKRVILELSR